MRLMQATRTGKRQSCQICVVELASNTLLVWRMAKLMFRGVESGEWRVESGEWRLETVRRVLLGLGHSANQGQADRLTG